MGSVPCVIQERIDQLDKLLSTTVTNPEWFADPAATQAWIEEEIAELEAEQLAQLEAEKENSRPGRQLSVEKFHNVILPIVPQWGVH